MTRKHISFTMLALVLAFFGFGCQSNAGFSKDDLIGTWEWKGQAFVLFSEDESYKLVDEGGQNLLETAPSDFGIFEMEGMEITLISSEESPSCPGITGIYVVEQREDNTINLVAQEDSCELYSGNFLVFNRSNFFKNTPLTKISP